jgi:glutaminyl-peptide cyclotransferase
MRIAIKLSLILIFFIPITKSTPSLDHEFNKFNAFNYLKELSEIGPRIPNSIEHGKAVRYISDTLKFNNWEVYDQIGIYKGVKVHNIIGYYATLDFEKYILGSHYDSRLEADQDKVSPSQPVLGANDGASSAAILLELSRVIPDNLRKNVLLVFFDMEDNGGIDNYEWIMGSTYFVDQLTENPKGVIVLDMVGDKQLNIYREKSSNQDLTDEIWDIANDLGISEFINQPKYTMIDDHTPFLNAGIPAVDIIDFDYLYWHTTQDTVDKISSDSLGKVGEVILTWIIANTMK